MNCDDIRALLAARADGELGAADSLHMEAHLGSCAACTDIAANHDGVVRALRQGLRAPGLYMKAPAGLSERVMRAVQMEAGMRPDPISAATRAPRQAQSPWQRLMNWLITPSRGLGLAAGALAAVALGVGVFVGRPDTAALTAHDITASHVRALLGARETDVLSSDRHTVKPWFNGRIDYAPPVADLAARGFPLVGGRLDYIDGRPVAVLVYRSSQHPVDLYVRPEAGSDTEPAVRTERGYQLVVWRNAGIGYWAITDASADVAQAFARALRGG